MNFQSGLGRIKEMKHPLAVLMVFGIVLRLVLMPLFSFNIDLTYWMKVFVLIDGGNDLYSVGGYYYTPVWGYVLGAMDGLAHLLGVTDFGTLEPEMYPYQGKDYSISPYITSIAFNFIVKVPLLLTDVAVAYLLYGFVKRIADENKALLACLLWFLCPLTLLESAVHAMFDNMSAMFMLMAFIAAYDRKYLLAGGVYILAIFTKFFPLFFVFLLVAIVFRNEGINMSAIKAVGKGLVSAVAVMLIIELPAIIRGQFWDTIDFMTQRVGVSANTLDSMGIWFFAGLFALILILGLVLLYFCRIRPDIIRTRFLDISQEEREAKVRRIAIRVAAVMTVLVLLYSVYSLMVTDSFTFVDLFNLLGKRFVLLLSVYTLILEAYIAYRFLFSEGEGTSPYLRAFMLSAIVIFLWPPSPQYLMVILPAIVLYAAVEDCRFIRPYLLMCTLMALYDIVLAGPSPIFSLAEYTSLIDISSLIPMVGFVTSYIFGGVPTIAAFMAVFGGAAYLSLLYILYISFIARRHPS